MKGICAACHAANQQTHTQKQAIRIVQVSGILVKEVSKMVSVFWVCKATCIYCAAIAGEPQAQGVLLKPCRQLPSGGCSEIISGGDIIRKLGGGECLGCLTAHLSSQRININPQGDGVSCWGKSIITEEGPDATEFPELVEGVWESGDRGMSKSAAGGGCVFPCFSLVVAA